MNSGTNGDRFGHLVVIGECEERTPARKRRLMCRCDCGHETTVIAGDLRSGRTTSCGCVKKAVSVATRLRAAEDLTGQVFADGGITVIGPGELVSIKKGPGQVRRGRLWRCLCACGREFRTRAAALRKGQTTSCGCRKRQLTSDRMRARAIRYDLCGVSLTLAELAEVSGVDGPTIRYRMTRLGLSPQQAALGRPLRHFRDRPKGRIRKNEAT